MNRNFIKTTALILIVIYVISSVGCINWRANRAALKNAALKYISEKYPDDTFETVEDMSIRAHPENETIIMEYNNSDFYDGKIAMYSSNYMKSFQVRKDTEGNYCDSYLNIKFEEETEAKLMEILSGYGSKVELLYVPSYTPVNGTSETSFEEYFVSSSFDFYAIICCDEIEDVEAIANSLKDKYIGAGLNAFSKIYLDTTDFDFTQFEQHAKVNNNDIYADYVQYKTYSYEITIFTRGEEILSFEINKPNH